MRALLIGVLAVSVAGCTFGVKTCSSTPECGAGATCEQGFCVAVIDETGGGDGQTGGGTAQGGGVGTVGGGAQGGGTTTTGGGGGTSQACLDRTTPCPTGFECREPTPGVTQCEVAFSGVSAVVADGGSLFNFSPLPARFQLVRKVGFTSASEPGFIAIALTLPDGGVASGTAQAQAGGFDGSLVADIDGTYSVVGSVDLTNEDGGVEHIANSPVAFVVDTTPPVLSITPPPPAPYVDSDAGIYRDPGMTSAYRRDEIVSVVVTSNDQQIDPTSVRLLVTPPSASQVEYPSTGSCSDGGVGYCASFTIDIATLPFPALRDNLTLAVRGSDRAGNSNAATTTVALPVTRWNFARSVASGAIRASRALASDGRVIIGAQSGGLWALELDGGLTEISTDPVLSSPAIGFTGAAGGDAEVLFAQINMNKNNIYGPLRYFNLRSAGNPQLGADCGETSVVALSSPIPGASLAVMGDGSLGVRGVGLGVYGVVSFNRYYFAQGGPFSTCNTTGASDSGLPSASFPGNVVANGTTVLLPNDDGRIAIAQSAGSSFSSVDQLPSNSLGVGQINGLALTSSSSVVGGAGASGIGALFTLDLATGRDAGSISGTLVSSPVVAANGEIIALFRSSSGGQAEARKYAAMTPDAGVSVTWSASVVFPASPAPGAPSPVLGENDVAYFVSNNASLLAVQQSTWTKQYEGGTGTLAVGSVLSSPTIGCNYRRPGTGTGVLYWATDNGYVVSYIVDSPGLDSNAIWPKYQHDQRNTGNLGTSVAVCP